MRGSQAHNKRALSEGGGYIWGGAWPSLSFSAQPPASGAEDRTPEILAPQNLSRGLVNVAAKLTHNKDVRDLFVDLVEKVSSPVQPPVLSLSCV